jgi:hypothetical protein
MSKKFLTFDDFFVFYLRQHSCRANRWLHALGTAVGLVMTIAALHHPWLALLWIPVGYAFSWAGHLLVEGNRPATWGHPGWSLLCDFRMLGLMITGRLDGWMANAEDAESHAPAATTSAQD